MSLGLLALLAPSASAQSFTLTDGGIVVPRGAEGTYYEHNVGSPNVTYNPDDDEFVMFFEYRGAWGTPSRCNDAAGTEWGIGRATSPDGVTWTVDDEPTLHPEVGTFWECAAVQPTVVYEAPGSWHMYFKAFQEAEKTCDDDTGNADGLPDPAWGCATVTGVGHAISSDGIHWTVPSALPVIDVTVDPTPEDFGWPRVVQVSGTWLMFMNYGNNGITLATAEDPAGPWTWEGYQPGLGTQEVLAPGAETWMEDELIVADVSCNDEPSDSMLNLWFGGHDRDPADFWGAPLSRALAYAESPDVESWSVGDPPEREWDQSDINSNVAWRAWSTLPLGDEHYLVFYQQFVNGGNEVGLAYTTADTNWVRPTLRGDVCTFYGAAPEGQPDAYETNEEQSLTVPAPGLLSNDQDGERNAITAAVATAPAHGAVVINPDGSFTYTPNEDFAGIDTFTYTATDTSNVSDAIEVALTVSNLQDAPLGRDDRYDVTEDEPLTVDAAEGVLANDQDADGDVLTATLVDAPARGTLALSPDGSFVYTPADNASGDDVFTYTVTDGTDTSTTVVVRLTVDAVNDAPVATDDAFAVDEDGQLSGSVLANDTDVDGDALTVTLWADVTSGELALEADGTFTYQPNPDFHGEDRFTYVLSDGAAISDPATVTLTVGSAGDPPASAADGYTGTANTTLEVTANAGVLSNDQDVEGDALVAILVEDAAFGELNLRDDGSFWYVPDEDFVGVDSFIYVANDGTLDGSPTLVTLTIEAGTRSGCGCHTTSPSSLATTLGLLAFGLMRRRRRG